MNKTLEYLATPYSHPNPAVRLERFNKVNRIAAKLMAEGRHIFSPISHTHPIALEGDLPKNWEYWAAYDEAILKVCKTIIIYKQEGWDTSTGVGEEIKLADKFGIEIEFIEDDS